MDTPFGNGLDFRIGGNGGQGAPRLPVDHRCIDKISETNMKILPQPDVPIRCREFRIRAIGARFIMSEGQLEAYREANFSECRTSGKRVSVNQNMRFDQSMRVLKQILDNGELGL